MVETVLGDQFAIMLNPARPTAGELDGAGSLLGGAAVIAPHQGAAAQGVSFVQQAYHHPDGVPQKAAIARIVHERRSDGAVQSNHLARLDPLVVRVGEDCPVDRLPCRGLDRADRLV